MYTTEQIDVLDLLIEIIRQHEAKLDQLITTLETRLEQTQQQGQLDTTQQETY